jgi:hypothetical protein
MENVSPSPIVFEASKAPWANKFPELTASNIPI